MPNQQAEDDRRHLINDVQYALNESAKFIYTGLAEDYERHQIEDVAYQTPGAIAAQIAGFIDHAISVVDIGSGTGMVGDALLDKGVDACVTGVDLGEPMLREIDSPAYTHRVLADAVRNLPIRSNAFDVAVSAGLMEHVIDPESFIPEMLRVVKPGGLAVIAYAPNRQGRSEFLDQNAGLLSHDALHTQAIVERQPAEIADRRVFKAYRDGDRWIHHESFVLRCR